MFLLIVGIIFSIIIAIVCTYAAFKATTTPGQLISIITGITFIGLVVAGSFIYKKLNEYDFKTMYGMKVIQGDIHQCSKEDLDAWSKWTVDFWKNIYKTDSFTKSFKTIKIYCQDTKKTYFPWINEWFGGANFKNSIFIGYDETNPSYSEYVLKHEISHSVLWIMDRTWGDEVHHKKLADVGFPH